MNLYVQGLPKSIGGDSSHERIRRICARFGKIMSFKLMDSPKFAHNIAYVAYKYPAQASFAYEHLHQEPEFSSEKVCCDWHMPKNPEKLQQKKLKTAATLDEKSNLVLDDAIKLQECNLLKDQFVSHTLDQRQHLDKEN